MRALGAFLFLLCTIQNALACPPLVANVCKCQELHNGINLDCSNSRGDEVVQLLRESQASIGLIQQLTMNKANIRRIAPSFFAGLYIKQLDLSYNQMVEIDDNAFKGMSPVLQEIVLKHNNLTKIPVKALTGIGTLLRLDLSNNTIGDLTEADAFPTLPKLFDINLGSNKICNVHSSIFQKIKNTVQTINFGHNCFKTVPSSAIRGLTQLQSIHMHRNNISQLDALNFLNLPVLDLLNLAGNNISDMNRQAFLNVPNLLYLYLTDNKISKIPAGQFITFEKLQMLDLTGNNIESVVAGSFAQLPNLRQLFLGNNKIATIEKNAFTNSSIAILILANNKLESLPEGILDGLTSIQQISFKHNQIKTIDHNAFYNAPSVVMMDLSQNQITDLPPATFLSQLNLLLVDLSSNNITRTPYAAFNRRIRTVILKENPLVCSEKVHLIQDGIGTFVPEEADLVCGAKPKPTTPPPIQMRRMSPGKTLSTGERVRPSGAFQQVPELHSLATQESPTDEEPELLPSRPERPSILNTRPRVRGPTGSDIAHTDSASIPLETSSLITDDGNEEPLSGEEVAPDAPEFPEAQPQPQQEEKEISTILPSTTTLGPRVYTDIADNPNLIHPFPVPFLKYKGPQIHQAQRIKMPTSERPRIVQEHTLPPSIVLEPRSRPANPEVSENTVEAEKAEPFPLQGTSAPVKEKETRSKVKESRFSSPTIIVIVCVSVAILAMIIVCIGLCVMKHRQENRFTSSYSDSSVARTNAYVHSQAQMNMVYGTLGRERMVSMPEEGHPWIYNPGPNYCNYYK